MSRRNRRNFLGTALAGCVGGWAARPRTLRAAEPQASLRPGSVILFQGDSITDARRDRNRTEPNDQPGFGGGYAWMAASQLLVDRPDAGLKFFNRGVGGNKVHQLAERWQQDCIDLRPDVLSILIGVNDIWHRLMNRYDGTAETYERDYRALLQRTKSALPDAQLVICEPFVLKCGAVNDSWFPEFDRFREIARTLAREFSATWVAFQEAFDKAVAIAPPQHWAEDGVHPTPHGSALMAHVWQRAVAAD